MGLKQRAAGGLKIFFQMLSFQREATSASQTTSARINVMCSSPCRHQLAAQGADLESHATREQALGGQLAALEAQVAAAEERTRDATSGLALAQMTAEQARADAKRCKPDATVVSFQTFYLNDPGQE